ncbi:ABC transporter permease [Neobacillus kokaensis]|uniref:Transport permease YfiM n=1 Tax=Neobacillus kokaensis TaxID=2759023 RepID=A0ABQ3N4P4_9BACI|nr:ABC transporter permease [Neobacillus kokaensis]GHH99624.1 putative transport permease YfiM [Neobacillus kokaensis]
MSFLWLAWKDLLLVIRDKKAFITLIAMPLLLIAILGAAFGNMMKEEEVVIKKFTLGAANLDQGVLSKVLTEEVFGKSLSDQIEIQFFSEKDLLKKIKNHELEVGIIIQPDFTSSLFSGKETKVKLVSVPDPGVKPIIVQTVIEQFAQTIPIQTMLVAKQGPAFNQKDILDEKTLIAESTLSKKTKPVGSFQYYAAAMGVMFLLMTVVQGITMMIREKEETVYQRLMLTNLTYPHYLFGKMLGLIILCLIQMWIIIIGTNLIFEVDWGPSVSGVIIMTFAFVINACGLGMLAGALIKTEKGFNVSGMLGTQIMAALGGSMVPLYIFPDWVVSLTKFLPNGLALQTYLKLMSGASLMDILPAIAGSIVLGLLFFTIGLICLTFERRGKYA